MCIRDSLRHSLHVDVVHLQLYRGGIHSNLRDRRPLFRKVSVLKYLNVRRTTSWKWDIVCYNPTCLDTNYKFVSDTWSTIFVWVQKGVGSWILKSVPLTVTRHFCSITGFPSESKQQMLGELVLLFGFQLFGLNHCQQVFARWRPHRRTFSFLNEINEVLSLCFVSDTLTEFYFSIRPATITNIVFLVKSILCGYTVLTFQELSLELKRRHYL